MNRPEHIFYDGKKYIKGLHGVPNFEEYKNTKPEDWYWLENSKKEENHFLWHDTSDTNSENWKTKQKRQ